MAKYIKPLDWSKAIEKEVLRIEADISDIIQDVAIVVFSEVIDHTPVWFTFHKHAGTAKYNWTASIDNPIVRVLTGTDKTGETTKERMRSIVGKFDGNKSRSIYFSNSVPYILTLEDGGYPNPPAQGSYNVQTHAWEIRSEGGFSKQAPHGMVKTTMSIFNLIAQEVAKAKGFK